MEIDEDQGLCFKDALCEYGCFGMVNRFSCGNVYRIVVPPVVLSCPTFSNRVRGDRTAKAPPSPRPSFQRQVSSMSESYSLPQTEAYVDISVLDGGGMLGHVSFVHEGQEGELPMSCWVAYILHPSSGRRMLWDVGISQVL
jgi:hypothetical protein